MEIPRELSARSDDKCVQSHTISSIETSNLHLRCGQRNAQGLGKRARRSCNDHRVLLQRWRCDTAAAAAPATAAYEHDAGGKSPAPLTSWGCAGGIYRVEQSEQGDSQCD